MKKYLILQLYYTCISLENFLFFNGQAERLKTDIDVISTSRVNKQFGTLRVNHRKQTHTTLARHKKVTEAFTTKSALIDRGIYFQAEQENACIAYLR